MTQSFASPFSLILLLAFWTLGMLVPSALAEGPAVPVWIKPGVRVSSTNQHVVLRFSPTELGPATPGDLGEITVEDPAHPGHFLTVHPVKSEVVGDVGQLQILAVSGNKVYAVNRAWQPTRYVLPGGELRPQPSSAQAWPMPGPVRDVAVDPAAVRQSLAHPGPGERVTRETIQSGGKSVPAVRSFLANGPIRNDFFFDAETGLRLRATMQAQLPDAEWTFEGQNPRGALVIHRNEFSGIRQVVYPWSDKPAPDWIKTAQTVKVHYEELTSHVNNFHPPDRVAADVSLPLAARGPDFIAFDMPTPNGPKTGEMMVGACAASPGSPFLPPAGLAELKVGQKLDVDPFTGLTLTVTSVQRQNDVDVVALTESGPGVTDVSIYNRATGALLYEQLDTPVVQGVNKSVRVTLTIQ